VWWVNPSVLLAGLAVVRDVAVEPRANLAERLVDAAMAGPVPQRAASSRIADGALVVG
jgi:hypothetical protein